MQSETILCEFRRICATGNGFEWLTVGRHSILNFPAKIRTELCRALLCGDWWWLITQPRPIWKKAPPGLQRPKFDKAGIPQYFQDPNPSDPPISGGLGGLIPQPLTSHPIIKKGWVTKSCFCQPSYHFNKRFKAISSDNKLWSRKLNNF